MSTEKEGNRQECEEKREREQEREGGGGKAAEWSFYLLLFHFDRKLKAMNKNAKWSTMQKGKQQQARGE